MYMVMQFPYTLPSHPFSQQPSLKILVDIIAYTKRSLPIHPKKRTKLQVYGDRQDRLMITIVSGRSVDGGISSGLDILQLWPHSNDWPLYASNLIAKHHALLLGFMLPAMG